MKTSPRFPLLAPSGPVRLLVSTLVFSTAVLAVHAGEEAKTYTLFMGTDFSVQQNKEYHRVRDVSGGNFVIKVKDQEIMIPMRSGSGSLKVDQSLKLTPVSAR